MNYPTIEQWKEMLADRARQKAIEEAREKRRIAAEKRREREKAHAAKLKAQAKARKERAKERARKAAEERAANPPRQYERKVQANKPRLTEYQRACADVISEMVAIAYGVPKETIFSPDRKARTVLARHCLTYELHERVGNMFISELARYMGTHHTSVMHALKMEHRRRSGATVRIGRPGVPNKKERVRLAAKPHLKLIPYAGFDPTEGFMNCARNPYRGQRT